MITSRSAFQPSRWRGAGYPQSMVSFPIRALSLAALLVAASCGDPSLSVMAKAIVDGRPDPRHPAVGWLTTGNQTAHCTATVIAPRFALTAAHCLLPAALDLILDGVKVSIRRKIVHPRYEEGAPGHTPSSFDIALIELAEEVSGIEPAVLAATPPRVGERLLIVGFGKTNAALDDYGVKRVAETEIVAVTAQTLWLGAAHQMRPTTCSGDSGGPSFVVRDGVEQLIGVHSTSEGAPASCIGVGEDLRVDVFAGWIEARGEHRAPGEEGDPCGVEKDCAEGLVCASSPHFVCSRPCTQAGSACPGGEHCLAIGATKTTLCLPASAGELGFGQPCDGRGQCAYAGSCLNTRDHGPRCSLFCGDPAVSCPSGSSCDTTMFSFAKVCLADAGWQPPAPVTPPQGALFGAPCESNGSCAQEGLCRAIDGGEARCTRACGPASPCPGDHACQTVGSRRLCVAAAGGCQLAAGDRTTAVSSLLVLLLLLVVGRSWRRSRRQVNERCVRSANEVWRRCRPAFSVTAGDCGCGDTFAQWSSSRRACRLVSAAPLCALRGSAARRRR